MNTIAPNEIAYSNDKGVVEDELDFVGFGGEMNSEDNDRMEENIEKWHEICTRKINEAYEEYMKKAKLENHKKWIDSLGKSGERLNLDECDLRGLDYSKYLFEQGSITDCKFDESELNNIDFYAATLSSSSFKNSILKEVDFYKGELSYTDFSSAYIRYGRFSKCDISEADFRYCKIEDSNLVNTILYMTDFSYAELSNVDVSKASFDETIVRGIKLKNIIGLEEAQIESINIGTYEEPELLYGEEARAWFNRVI